MRCAGGKGCAVDERDEKGRGPRELRRIDIERRVFARPRRGRPSRRSVRGLVFQDLSRKIVTAKGNSSTRKNGRAERIVARKRPVDASTRPHRRDDSSVVARVDDGFFPREFYRRSVCLASKKRTRFSLRGEVRVRLSRLESLPSLSRHWVLFFSSRSGLTKIIFFFFFFFFVSKNSTTNIKSLVDASRRSKNRLRRCTADETLSPWSAARARQVLYFLSRLRKVKENERSNHRVQRDF